MLGDAVVLPDADVTWAAPDQLLELYRVKVDQPFVTTELTVDRNCVQDSLEQLWGVMKTTVTRRKDLHNVYLKAATIVSKFLLFGAPYAADIVYHDTFCTSKDS